MKIFEKKPARVTAFVLSLALVCSCVGISTYAAGISKKDEQENANSGSSSASAGLSGIMAGQDETVYVIASADGTPEKVIVSNWIKNPTGSDTLTDDADLSNVVNVKGDETYTINSENMRVWDAKGNDIYLQGESSKTLPVDISIQYTLDGKAISPDELAGKSGKVTIRFNYTNTQYKTVKIDGKDEKIYVPFVMLTGMILDNDCFKNIEISNGKILNDGDHTVVAGLALPGLSENLNLTDSSYSLPDYVEITADVTDFELSTTLTLATNEVFNGLDFDDTDSLDDLSGAIGQLTDAMDQLMDGSSALYDGLSTLLQKSGILIAGIDKLAAGSNELASGTKDLKDGAAELQENMELLSLGLNKLSSNSASLTEGAEDVFNIFLAQANAELKKAGMDDTTLTIENYAKTLQNLLDSMKLPEDKNPIYKKVNAAVKANEPEIRKGVEAAVRQNVLNGILDKMGNPMTAADYEKAVASGNTSAQIQAITAALDAQMNSDTIKAAIDANVEREIEKLTQKNMKSITEQLTGLKDQLDSYNEFYEGIVDYTDGVDEANTGAAELNAGSKDLAAGTIKANAGANKLAAGIKELQSGGKALTEGVTQLKNGAMQLSGGLKQFNEQGVQKLSDLVNGDVSGFITRLRATADVSKDYTTFSGNTGKKDSTVRFIYRTDAIEKAE